MASRRQAKRQRFAHRIRMLRADWRAMRRFFMGEPMPGAVLDAMHDR